MKRIFIFLFILLAGCQDVEKYEFESTEGCPYEGAIVEITYPKVIPFDAIVEIWNDNNWRSPNPDAIRGHTITGLIEGSFEGPGWVVTSATILYKKTTIYVWVNQESDERKHKQQIKKAEKLLKKIQAPIEKEYKVKGIRQDKVHLGCIID